MNLYQRINLIRKDVSYVQKDKSVSTGGGSYKAVTHDMVTAMTRGKMVEHGVVCYPFLVASQSLPKEEGSKQFRYEATYDFVFINVDDPNEALTVRIQAHAMDNADKAPGKALSYAKKYAILKLFELETGEDEESRVPEEFDVSVYLGMIAEAKDINELKTAFQSGIEASARFPEMQKIIIKAKDSKKKGFQK